MFAIQSIGHTQNDRSATPHFVGAMACLGLIAVVLTLRRDDPTTAVGVELANKAIVITDAGSVKIHATASNASSDPVKITDLYADMGCRAQIDVGDEGIEVPAESSVRIALTLLMDQPYLCAIDQVHQTHDIILRYTTQGRESGPEIFSSKLHKITFVRPIHVDRPYLLFDGAELRGRESGRSVRSLTVFHDPSLTGLQVTSGEGVSQVNQPIRKTSRSTSVSLATDFDGLGNLETESWVRFHMHRADKAKCELKVPVTIRRRQNLVRQPLQFETDAMKAN